MNQRFKQFLISLWSCQTGRKPSGLSWRDCWGILFQEIRYQPLLFPDGTVIPQRCSASVIDSRDKLKHLDLPEDLNGKTFMDIGCAEGFFVREAARRNARLASGCDLTASRIEIAKKVAATWPFDQRVRFRVGSLFDIPDDWRADIVTCLSVCHHLHGGNHDTWQMLSSPERHHAALGNMLQAVEKVASLTGEFTIWEYCYEYGTPKSGLIDYALLGKTWVDNGLYQQVIFKGLSQDTPTKDRAVYHAFR